MRSLIDSILSFLGTASLTDAEYGALENDDQGDLEAVYNDMDAVLLSREAVSTLRDRLRYYFLAKGVAVTQADDGRSNVTIGGGVCGD